MATITRSVSSKMDAKNRSEILLRVSVKRGKVVRLHSGVFIPKERFVKGKIIMPRKGNDEILAMKQAEDDLNAIESQLLDFCISAFDDDITKDSLQSIIETYHQPAKPKAKPAKKETNFHAAFSRFVETRDVTEHWRRELRVVARLLHRFEQYTRLTSNRRFTLDIDTFSHVDMSALERFYRNEWRIFDKYPQIYDDYPATIRTEVQDKRPLPRGDNAWTDIHKKVRAFFSWCRKMGITSNNPSEKYDGKKTAIYGTPWYLNIEERDRIADLDLSAYPKLAIQRDIFVFQCHVGCRVSDLKSLTKDNISNGILSYVPIKTSKERTETIQVPLTTKALELISKYPDGRKLFPFISDQKYNEAIKKVCKLAGIDRIVTIINPTTGKTEQRPLFEIASSHMARRTFIGNLYKKVKDPNLIGSMTGHVEGSTAFSRYRDIDIDIKRDTVSLIE